MQTADYQPYFDANRDGWNKRTNIHKDSAFYDVAAFKAGQSIVNAIELEKVGNVSGRSLYTSFL